jgi:ubiquitin carboxyl-terminal hydrolase 7
MVHQASKDETSYSSCTSAQPLCHSLGINPMEQQDTQEFWKLLLPQLPQPVIDTYTGSYEDYIIACDGTGRTRRKEIPFVDLSLEVPTAKKDDGLETSETSLIHSFRSMFQTPELLSVAEGNGWRPPPAIKTKNHPTNYSEKVDALKGQLLHRQGLPSLLQLHLKRFQYDWQTHTITKLNHRYTFPEEIDLKEIIATKNDTIIMPYQESQSSTQYVLQSVIVHAGPFGSGHYYSYCKPMLTLEEKEEEVTNTSSKSKTNKNTKRSQWYRFDDEIVTPVTIEEVLADAYGGICSTSTDTGWNEKHLRNTARRSRLFRWFTSTAMPFSSTKYTYGYGGRDSCAYVLQYVRKRDIPLLYKGNKME